MLLERFRNWFHETTRLLEWNEQLRNGECSALVALYCLISRKERRSRERETNYGIIQNRRHDKQKGGSGSGGAQALLQDARLREIAKQMGLEAKDFGDEAQSLWQLLGDMAANDPKAYQDFIHEQLKDGPPAAPSHDQSTGLSNQDVHTTQKANKQKGPNVALPRYFTPTPGFVVKCAMHHTIKCQQETKLFLNCCAHEMIDMPKNPNNGSEVPKDTRAVPSTGSLVVPLVAGKLREIQDFAGGLCVAIDVAFHPWVMQRCEWDGNFKREVMKLAIEWVRHDASVRFVTPVGKFIKSRYKGGVAVGDEIVTAKFLVDPSQHSSKDADGNQRNVEAEDETLTSHTMDTPSALLKQIDLARKQEDESGFLIAPTLEKRALSSASQPEAPAMPDPKPRILGDQVTASDHPNQPREVGTTEAKKPLIQVIEPLSSAASTSNLSAAQTAVQKQKPTPAKLKSCAVKKGFLNSAKMQLYPTGSNEGKASSPYVNLLSRSKVVDLGEVERQKKQQEQQQRTMQNEVLSFLNPSEKQSSTPSSAEVGCGDLEFEQLCMEADSDLKPQGQQQSGQMDDAARQLFGNGLDEISKFLTL